MAVITHYSGYRPIAIDAGFIPLQDGFPHLPFYIPLRVIMAHLISLRRLINPYIRHKIGSRGREMKFVSGSLQTFPNAE